MYDNCTCTRKKEKKKQEEEEEEEKREREAETERGKILAALHGILGPTGAAVPGENPFTVLHSLLLWPRQCSLFLF